MKSWNLVRVAHEEDRGVVPDQVVVALVGIQLQCEATRVADGVREALLTRHGGEPCKHRRPLPDLCEKAGLRELRDVVRHLEEAMRAGALGVHDAFRDALAVEVLHLLNDVVVVEYGRAVGADGQRELVARRRDSRVGGRDGSAVVVASGRVWFGHR